MPPIFILACFLGYFLLLLGIAYFTTRGRDTLSDFFVAGRRAPWYIVAYGMVGTSISGVTFISVPGAVRDVGMTYLQVVLGYLAGYVVIALVLLPLYYRTQLTSIYSYLESRLGPRAYRTGAFFFLLSRSTGTAVRLYLMAGVLQLLVMDALGIPFAVTGALILLMILAYTGRGGMRTILWTDTLQSTALIGAVVVTLIVIGQQLHTNSLIAMIQDSPLGYAFEWDWRKPNHFIKDFLSGAFICIVMTGLDQAQMQKNLSIRTLPQAQTNMAAYSIALVIVNLLFVSLGVLLYAYVQQLGIAVPAKTDQLYPLLASQYLGSVVAVLFMLGLTAAAYSSADDALTALTTSICIDLLGMQKHTETARDLRTRRWVHGGVTVGIFLMILALRGLEHLQHTGFNVIGLVLKAAAYTYGPLLGLFAFGILTRRSINDRYVLYLCIAAPVLCALLEWASPHLFGGYRFGNELIMLNGAIVFGGCIVLKIKQ